MRSLLAFMNKEIMDHIRSGKLMLLGILFTLFGIMNPATAKLTPWLLEMLSESMAESGMVITAAEVTALDSWMQFFKNVPMALLAFILLESNIFTKEYQRGTLVLSLTKGLQRYKVVVSKATVALVLWSVGYWLCFGVTYAYNAYYWDNAVAQNLAFSVIIWWVFGLWVIALMVLLSTVVKSNVAVLLGVGGVVAASYLMGLLPKCGKYMPTFLTGGTSLVYGLEEVKTYLPALIIVIITGLACLAVSLPAFNKKQL